MKKIIHYILLVVIVVLFSTLSFLSLTRESMTYDELINMQEGKNAWVNHTFDVEVYHPPLAKDLQMAPVVFMENVMHVRLGEIQEKNIGRSVSLVFGIFLLLSVYFVSKQYFGPSVGLFSAFLLATEPNILALSHIINNDVLVTLLIFIDYFLLIKLLTKFSTKIFLLFSFFLGLGMSSKLSFDSFFTLSAVAIVFLIKKKNALNWVMSKKKYIIPMIFISLLAVWSTYFFTFHVVIKSRSDSQRVSQKLILYANSHHLEIFASAVRFGETQPIPLGDFIAMYKNVALSKPSSYCFFLGNNYPKCYWYFMPITFLEKTSFPLLLLGALSMIVFAFSKKRKKEYVYFIIPFFVILIQAATSGAFPLNRYMLPAYPFLAVLASYSLATWNRKRFFWMFLISMLVVWEIVIPFHVFPHFLSYVNELAGPRQNVYSLFESSNLDWGQSLEDIKPYLDAEKASTVYLSYYGRANGDLYGLPSDSKYGSYKAQDICAFHTISQQHISKKVMTVMSISNWRECGYDKISLYKKPKAVLSDSFLIF